MTTADTESKKGSWTPAPWHVQEDAYLVVGKEQPDGWISMVASCESLSIADHESEANCRLIAASPEMAELLERIVKHGIGTNMIREAERILARIRGEA